MPKPNLNRILLNHSWLAFRRAHHFERSMGIKIIMAFVGSIFVFYLFMAGVLLPKILEHFYPDKPTGNAFFSILWVVFLSDLSMRFFIQKLPKQRIRTYLTLPVSRKRLAASILLRSWFSPFNLYLFAFLVPFLIPHFLHGHSTGVFLAVFITCILLVALNHSIIIWMKTSPGQSLATALVVALMSAMALWGFVADPASLAALSESFGMAMQNGSLAGILVLLLFIVSLQTASLRGLLTSFYHWSDPPVKAVATKRSWMERTLAGVPKYGLFWELEYRLILRNKRASGNLKQWPILILAIPLVFYFLPMDSSGNLSLYYPMIMVAGGYGFFHLQYAYSWESRFFDLLATSQLSLARFIRAKYYFYSLMAIIQSVVLLPLMAIVKPSFALMLAGLLLFVIGPIFAFLLNMGVKNSTRIHPNKKASFNFEGTSGTLFVAIFAVVLSIIPLMIIAMFLPFGHEESLALVTGLTGMGFILTHKYWIKGIAQKFGRYKYINLNKYREKT